MRDEPATTSVPQDIELERLILGGLLVADRDLVVDAQRFGLSPDWFLRDDHRRLAGALFDLVAGGGQPDVAFLVSQLRADLDNPAAVYSLADGAVRPANLKAAVERLQATAIARRMVSAATLFSASLRDDPSGAVNGLPSRLADQLASLSRHAVTAESHLAESLPALAARLRDVPPRAALVGDLIAEQEISALHGQPRAGKSWIAIELGLAVATGLNPFGWDQFHVSAQRPVLLVGNEDSAATYAGRATALMRGRGVDELPSDFFHLIGWGVDLDDETWRHRVIQEIRSLEVALVILDPVRSVTACADRGPAELKPFATFLRRLVGETGVAVLLSHHDTKPQAGVPETRRRAQRASGGGLFSIVDGPIHVEAIGEHEALCVPDGYKHIQDPPSFTVTREPAGDDGVRLTASAAGGRSVDDVALRAAIVEHLKASGGSSGRAITSAVQRDRRTVTRTLEQMAIDGQVDQAEGPRRATFWCLK